jgi:N-methylhydantoinase A
VTRLGVDVGGTFTDVVLLADGELVTAKVPTTDDQSVGVVRGIEKACTGAGVDPGEVEAFTHATTVSVNALPEDRGATTALVTTAGFRDALETGRQTRPALYDLDATKSETLVPHRRRFEVDERATVEGIERPVDEDEDEVREVAARLRESGAESVAVSLLHAYAHPENERRVAELLREDWPTVTSPSRPPTRSSRSSASTSVPPRRRSTPTSRRRSGTTWVGWSSAPPTCASRLLASCRRTAVSPGPERSGTTR